MGVTATSILLGFCLTALAVCVILDRRPYGPGQLNYIPAMVVLAIVGMALGRHLLTLTTGI